MLTVFRFAVDGNRLRVGSCGFGVLDVVDVVEPPEHVEEEARVEREQEVDELGVIAVGEHHREVVVENYAELDLERNKNNQFTRGA